MGFVEAIEKCRISFAAGLTRPLAWRVQQLTQLEQLLRDNKQLLVDALASDLGKPAMEAWGTDIHPTLAHIRHLKKNLRSWTKPSRADIPLVGRPAKAYTLAEPLGVCLIIAPWNYPVLLLVAPLATAIAAGNAVVAKPSELAPATSRLLATLCQQRLDHEAIQIVEGGPKIASQLLDHRFDHIHFTGSTRVGRIVSQAAARFLTPTTLELGGKSPAIVEGSANLAEAAKRIVWGKFLNAGQSCIAPDYVLLENSVKQRFLSELTSCIDAFFGPNPQLSPELGRIVNPSHTARLSELLSSAGAGKVVCGGTVDELHNYVAPTVTLNPLPDSLLMTGEIFGPILPVLTVDSIDDAISHIVNEPKPLALYIFTTSQEAKSAVLERTTSGTVVVNHTMFQLALPDLAFGGVGDSGSGRHHGRRGFEQFSNVKSIVEKPAKYELDLIYPTAGRLKKTLLRRLLR